MSHSTDKQKILDYLIQGNSITFNDCQRLFGSNSLRERIKELRQEGVSIKTEKFQNPDTKRWHAVYRLETEPQIKKQPGRQAFEVKGQLQFIG